MGQGTILTASLIASRVDEFVLVTLKPIPFHAEAKICRLHEADGSFRGFCKEQILRITAVTPAFYFPI